MNKKNKYGKAILVTGFIAIVVVTICAFQKDKIVYKYYEYTIDKKYSKININDYYKDDNFNYVDDYTESGIKNRNDLINSIYYAINSGTDYIERYIDSDYTNYINDINTLTAYNGAEFKKVISTLNNFVHPYNSSNNVKISYGGDYKIGISINRAYTQDEINEIIAYIEDLGKKRN